MKTISKNILIISILIVINLAIFLFCKIITNEENYIWESIPSEKATLISYACLDILRVNYFIYANSINIFLFGIYYIITKNRVLGISILFISIGVFWGSKVLFSKNLAENYYTIFKNQSVPEDFILVPITNAGNEIGEYLMEDIKSAYSKNRKHAIIGMGEIKYEPSIYSLNEILINPLEYPEIRGEAYNALVKINTETSISLSRIFINSYHPPIDEKVIQYLNTTPPSSSR